MTVADVDPDAMVVAEPEVRILTPVEAVTTIGAAGVELTRIPTMLSVVAALAVAVVRLYVSVFATVA